MLPWQPFDVVRCIFRVYTLSKIQYLNHSMLYKLCLVGVYARYTTCWCSQVYVDIPLSPTGLRVYIST